MKTSELSGAALDWAVSIIEGTAFDTEEISLFIEDWEQGEFNYSSDWALGGWIIQREGISLEYDGLGTWVAWLVHEDKEYGGVMRSEGQDTSPLVAAMRCYVTSKLGKKIELPEELNGQV